MLSLSLTIPRKTSVLTEKRGHLAIHVAVHNLCNKKGLQIIDKRGGIELGWSIFTFMFVRQKIRAYGS